MARDREPDVGRFVIAAAALIFAGFVLSERWPALHEMLGFVAVWVGVSLVYSALRLLVRARRATHRPKSPPSEW